MNWPTHSDYQDAIQNPGSCFPEGALRRGNPACDMLGLPRVMSGNFACVYELATPDERWAIRCFVRQVPGQQGRYARLGQHLKNVPLEYFVGFEYVPKGILVKGEWYPVVKMEWVDGIPLNRWVEEHLDQPEELGALAEKWRLMVEKLKEFKIAHGDLQHGNVLVNPSGALRLVDYDGMYAPVFGRARAPELGHANYQHPRRTVDFYEEGLDNFSALAIYLSLLAVRERPALWQEFSDGDNLLFNARDFKAPLDSKLLKRLKEIPHPRIQQLAAAVELSCLTSIAAVPDFSRILVAAEEGSVEKLFTAEKIAPIPLPKIPAAAPPPPQKKQEPRPVLAPVSPRVRGAPSGVPAWAWVIAAIAGISFFGAIFIFRKTDSVTVENLPANASGSSRAAKAVNPPPKVSPPPAPPKLQTSRLIATLSGHTGSVDALALSPDGDWLVSGSADRTVRLWDLKSGSMTAQWDGFSEGVSALEVNPAKNAIYTISPDNRGWVLDLKTKSKRPIIDSAAQRNLFSIVVSPDGKLFATGETDRRAVLLMGVDDGSLHKRLAGQTSWVKSVAFSGDGTHVAIAAQDETIAIWEAGTGLMKQNIPVPGNMIDPPCISFEGRWLATSDNRVVKLVDTLSGSAQQVLQTGEVTRAAFSDDGNYLVTAGTDLKWWEVNGGRLVCASEKFPGAPLTLALNRDGSIAAMTWAGQTSIKVWRVDKK